VSAGINAPARYRFRIAAVQLWRARACRRARLTALCPRLRVATRSPRNPSANRSNEQPGADCRARPPSGDCSSMARIRLLRRGCGSKRHLEQRRRGGESPVRIRSARADLPTRFRLARLPLDALKQAARGRRYKRVRLNAKLRANAIHGFGDFIGAVARQVLFQGVTEKLASGALRPARQALGALKNLVRNGDRCFHTKSITALQS